MLPSPIRLAFEFGAVDVRSSLAVIVAELVLASLMSGTVYLLVFPIRRLSSRRFAATGVPSSITSAGQHTALALFIVLAGAILSYDGWLIARGVDIRSHTIARIVTFTTETWHTLLLALGQIGLASLGLLIGTRLVRRLIAALEHAASRRESLRDRNLRRVFAGLDRAIVNTARLLVLTLACWLIAVPTAVVTTLLVVVRVYVIVSAGLLLIGGIAVTVDLLDERGRRYADRRGWIRHYDHLRSLLPTLSACLEYALWVAMAALVLAQLRPVQGLAIWGPRLVEGIALFFVGRVLIEIGHLEIDRRMLPAEGLDDVSLRRRATMTPLIHSVFSYAGYFATAVLVLASLGFNPVPFLAGAGILGLVIGFGAQSLINDVVSGFFILFENVYLVGELVEVDKAKGIVEAIEFRVTKIRDDEGRLHVMRNGDMKPVINYSKDYTMAVVPVEVAYDADLRSVFGALREAGRRVRADDRNVLAEMRIDGITAFGTAAMTVRTTTKVRPGSHEGVAVAMRLAIKEAFDRQAAADAPRKTLIPNVVRASSSG